VKTGNKLRLVLFIAVAAVHGALILGLAFSTGVVRGPVPEHPRVMKLADLAEAPPPPPPPEPEPEKEPEQVVEAIAETIIETDTVPEQTVVPPATLVTPQTSALPPSAVAAAETVEEYLPMFQISVAPRFDEVRISRATVYPPTARRSGVEGRVILELFIDRAGQVQRIAVLREDPPDWGFGEAAIRAFEGQRCIPAEANGQAVSVRYRYPVSFKLR
jgi:protein TonB